MPHYKNGIPAKVGDVVKGTTYNKRGEVIGIVTFIKPGSESCNCEVQGVLRRYGDTLLPDSGSDYGQLDVFEKVL